ncbi:hypothetical protein Bca52824_064929 [Brassica carinata]|uniref:Uncharacterized protein n=1 Tax=Brassica carinata TaxID=52824 RepID=A0A8X7U9H8_BRACI|nr:hypothetical protein Bca52824_064929 [Brassica carinata]
MEEKPVECMGINHIKANQVAFAKVEIETGFYSEGTDSSTSTTSPIDDDGYRKKERYECSLSGATEALKASTLCLPIVGKPVIDIEDLKHAVSSAVDLLQPLPWQPLPLQLPVLQPLPLLVKAKRDSSVFQKMSPNVFFCGKTKQWSLESYTCV